MTERVHDRVPLSLEVEYRTAGAFLVAYMANLSKGGLFIETEHPLPAGTELLLRFTVPASGPIEVHGHVAWIRPAPLEGKPSGMGVEFEQLDERHGEVIDGVVAMFSGLSLLLVSSDPNARSLLTRAVRSILANAQIIEVASGEAAEEAVRRAPDLAIIDLDDGEGSENLYTLRLAKSAQLPVIATSRVEAKRVRARELGADEALPAPIVVTDLQSTIVRLLGRPLRVG